MAGLTDIPGILVGHVSDFEALTGCTAILCDGATGGVDIRGSATGTEELDVLAPSHITAHIHAIVLAGGSAFGLEAASGVRRYLEKKGIGFDTRAAKVPIVCGAILYDLGIGKADVRPTREMGEKAAAAASSGPVAEGCVGAGTGATVGKAHGMAEAMKSGIGTATIRLRGRFDGVIVSALVACNALGDVRDPKTAAIVAGTRKSKDSREFADSAEVVRGAAVGFRRENTTLAVVATNARFNKIETTKVAQLASIGMARTIWPVNLMSDGDVTFALSLGNAQASVDAVGVAAAEALSEAILRSVRLSKSMGGVPGLAG